MERRNNQLIGVFALTNIFDAGLTYYQVGIVKAASECGIAANVVSDSPDINLTEAMIAKTVLMAGLIGATAVMARLKEVKVNLPFTDKIELDYVAQKTLKIGIGFNIGAVAWNGLNILLDYNRDAVLKFAIDSGFIQFLNETRLGPKIAEAIAQHCS